MDNIAKNPQFSKLARRLRREGRSSREIAAELTRNGYDISHTTVNNYLSKVMSHAAKLVGEDDVFEQDARKEIFDSAKQMKKVNEDYWDIVTALKEKMADEDFGVSAANALIKALGNITKQIELNSKLMGDIINTKVVNVSYLDMSQNMNSHINKYVKEQHSKILKIIQKDDNLTEPEKERLAAEITTIY